MLGSHGLLKFPGWSGSLAGDIPIRSVNSKRLWQEECRDIGCSVSPAVPVHSAFSSGGRGYTHPRTGRNRFREASNLCCRPRSQATLPPALPGAWQGMEGQGSLLSANLYGNEAVTWSEQVQELRKDQVSTCLRGSYQCVPA